MAENIGAVCKFKVGDLVVVTEAGTVATVREIESTNYRTQPFYTLEFGDRSRGKFAEEYLTRVKVLVMLCPGCGAISGAYATTCCRDSLGEAVQQAAKDGRRIELREGPVTLPTKCTCAGAE